MSKGLVVGICGVLFAASFFLPVLGGDMKGSGSHASGMSMGMGSLSGWDAFNFSRPGGLGAQLDGKLVIAWAANPVMVGALILAGIGLRGFAAAAGFGAFGLAFGGTMLSLGVDSVTKLSFGFHVWCVSMAALGVGSLLTGEREYVATPAYKL